MIQRTLLLACLSLACSSPAFAEEILTLAESKPLVATSEKVIRTSEFISLPKGQEKLQLTLTYYNGSSSSPEFKALRISSPSMPYVTEVSFAGGKTFVSDVSGDLGFGGNQIMIAAQGPRGATFGWKLTTPKPTITSISPQPVASGGTMTINGTNLCSDLLGNDVQINNQKARCLSATSNQIVVQVPEDVSGVAGTVSVNVAGLNAGALPLQINVTPVLKSLSQSWAYFGTPVTLNGDGFGTNPANVSLYMGPLKANVTNVTPTAITFTVPNGFAGMPWGFHQPLKLSVNGVKARNTLIMSTGDYNADGI